MNDRILVLNPPVIGGRSDPITFKSTGPFRKGRFYLWALALFYGLTGRLKIDEGIWCWIDDD
jgi:hypothetical protein